MVQEPDDIEVELRQKVDESLEGTPDLASMFELAEHLVAKNRQEEAVSILLDVVAIDRNWNERKAQKLVTDIFKQLGSSNQVVIDGRKKLSKILF